MTTMRDHDVRSAAERPGPRMLLIAAMLALLGGCANGLLQSELPAPATFRLGSLPGPAAAAAAPAPLPVGLTVGRPRAPTSLDTDRIAVVASARRFDYYAGVRWADTAPHMLQQQLVQALVASGRFAAVNASPSRVPAELMLDIELRRFEADAASGGIPVAHVQLQASLIDTRRGARSASFVSEAAVPATGNRRDAIVEAFDRAADEVVSEVVERVASAAAALEPAASD